MLERLIPRFLTDVFMSTKPNVSCTKTRSRTWSPFRRVISGEDDSSLFFMCLSSCYQIINWLMLTLKDTTCSNLKYLYTEEYKITWFWRFTLYWSGDRFQEMQINGSHKWVIQNHGLQGYFEMPYILTGSFVYHD